MRMPIRWGKLTRASQILSSVLVVMLLANVGGEEAAAVTGAERRQLQKAIGDDSECLKGFINLGRQKKNSTVATWNATALESPCNYTGMLKGVTCNNSRVVAIILPSANLTGTIPSSLAGCDFLESLDLSSNSLSGELPVWLGNFSHLSVCSLTNNNLSGPIPEEFALLDTLTYVDLSRNELSGSIPPQFGLLDYLQYFNVSNNKLSGLIPSTYKTTRFNASSFANNPELFGYPLSPSPPFTPYVSPPTPSDKKSYPTVFFVWVGLASGLGSLALTFCVAWLILQWRTRHREAAQRLSCIHAWQ